VSRPQRGRFALIASGDKCPPEGGALDPRRRPARPLGGLLGAGRAAPRPLGASAPPVGAERAHGHPRCGRSRGGALSPDSGKFKKAGGGSKARWSRPGPAQPAVHTPVWAGALSTDDAQGKRSVGNAQRCPCERVSLGGGQGPDRRSRPSTRQCGRGPCPRPQRGTGGGPPLAGATGGSAPGSAFRAKRANYFAQQSIVSILLQAKCYH
jgi:hypothetical protein